MIPNDNGHIFEQFASKCFPRLLFSIVEFESFDYLCFGFIFSPFGINRSDCGITVERFNLSGPEIQTDVKQTKLGAKFQEESTFERRKRNTNIRINIDFCYSRVWVEFVFTLKIFVVNHIGPLFSHNLHQYRSQEYATLAVLYLNSPFQLNRWMRKSK